MNSKSDLFYMQQALTMAQVATTYNEVPVGAVLVKNGQIIAQAFNQCIQNSDPSAHAEIMALRQAAKATQNYRLEDCELFVTLEPCSMCAGAIFNARIKRVVFGAFDKKAGAAGSVLNLFQYPLLNHHTTVQGGVLADSSITLLQHFFATKRKKHQEWSQNHKLREDFLRLPDGDYQKFIRQNTLAEWSVFNNQCESIKGVRLHYLDSHPCNPLAENMSSSPPRTTFLLLPGLLEYCAHYLDLFHRLKNQGHRVLVIDSVGSGFSDKPKKLRHASLQDSTAYHSRYLDELLEILGLSNVHFLVTDISLLWALKIKSISHQIYFKPKFNCVVGLKIKSKIYLEKNISNFKSLGEKALIPFPNTGFFDYALHLLQLLYASNYEQLYQQIMQPDAEVAEPSTSSSTNNKSLYRLNSLVTQDTAFTPIIPSMRQILCECLQSSIQLKSDQSKT